MPSTAKSRKKKKPSPEAIRVVPLHHPKMGIKLKDLVQRKKDRELFAPLIHRKATPPRLVYNGGPLISNVQVYTIFWGAGWNNSPAFTSLRQSINQFFGYILSSPLMAQLGEYSRPGKPIGSGRLLGTKVITAGAPVKSIEDSGIQKALAAWIGAGTVPAWNRNLLYFIYLDSGIKVIMGGGNSCSSFCGYHNDIAGRQYYAVMPFPSCAGCLGGLPVLDALTGTSSHELCEAVTDPVPPTGWYDNNNGEIGDICAWKFKKLGGFKVQLEWSNQAGKCR
jgi:hypothetical protein